MSMTQKDSFIARESMTSAFELASISNLSEMAYHHFMNYENEVMYLLNESKLSGVLSIGDLERFFTRHEGELRINQSYTSSNTIDYDVAAAFFERSATINEIPVVTEQGDFLGIIKREKTQDCRRSQRRSLKAARTGEYVWHQEEVRRFANETPASVFLYTYSHQKVMEQLNWEEQQKIKKHKLKADGDIIWKVLSNQEWNIFLQTEDNGSDILGKESRSCRPVFVNGKASFPDMEGKYFTIRNGYRITPNSPLNADRRIFMFGPCNVFGAYCKDSQTIAAYLQDLLNANGYMSWKVLNRGLCSGEFCYDQMFVEELSRDDIVIIIGVEPWVSEETEEEIAFQGDLSGFFAKIPNFSDYVLDSVSHFNYVVNEKLAEKIYTDICSIGILKEPKKSGILKKIQDYYINWSIREYFMEYFQQYGLNKESDDIKTGAIVMNCNPFTKGHRYLIEQALEMVDKLYIFVVEEDKSYFKFHDRFCMVEQGISDLKGVHVIPSGRYIISKDTFAQYFQKEQVQTVNSMDYDLYIFGEVVAEALGIKYRFVGEEPFDKVTEAYNEAMKRILPDFDVEVIEIPRALFDEKGTISATLVRKAIQEEDIGMIEKLCPESTVMYLKEELKLTKGAMKV